MNNEQIIDEVYNNYLTYIHDVVQGENQIYGDWYGKEEFINKCKTDNEFGEKWGLKIEERELSWDERKKLYEKEFTAGVEVQNDEWLESKLRTRNIPTRLTTITYNDKTIESYD
jgi:hypothetical protein